MTRTDVIKKYAPKLFSAYRSWVDAPTEDTQMAYQYQMHLARTEMLSILREQDIAAASAAKVDANPFRGAYSSAEVSWALIPYRTARKNEPDNKEVEDLYQHMFLLAKERLAQIREYTQPLKVLEDEIEKNFSTKPVSYFNDLIEGIERV